MMRVHNNTFQDTLLTGNGGQTQRIVAQQNDFLHDIFVNGTQILSINNGQVLNPVGNPFIIDRLNHDNDNLNIRIGNVGSRVLLYNNIAATEVIYQ